MRAKDPSCESGTIGRQKKGSPLRIGFQLNLDRVRKECVTPFVERPHEIRLGMDCPTFAIKPFASVGIERKMPNVVVAGLLPMLDRQRLAIMLTVEIGLHPFHPAWLSRMVFREEDLRAIPPEHQNVPLFRAEKSTKAQQFAIGVIGRTIVRRHICIEKPNSYAVAIASTRASCKATQIPGNAFIRIKAKHPI